MEGELVRNSMYCYMFPFLVLIIDTSKGLFYNPRTRTGAPCDKGDVMPQSRDVRMKREQHTSIADIIRERMRERGLSPRDLAPIIGSRSRVSEILAGRRDISISIARALYKHLDIPADILLQEQPIRASTEETINWNRFPMREMMNKGWIERSPTPSKHAEELIRPLRRAAGAESIAVLPRKNDQNRVNAKVNPYALLAWQWQVRKEAMSMDVPGYREGTVTQGVLREIARMSPRKSGPRDATDFLTKHCGIPVVFVPHLSRTYLDAAVFFVQERPIIGITLRYNRIDSFWYTLMHELAHICLHSGLPQESYIDDMTMSVDDGNNIEREADDLARESLIPDSMWGASGILDSPTPQDVTALAMEIGVNPAVIAGRIRYETGDYRRLSQFVGNGTVRQLFME